MKRPLILCVALLLSGAAFADDGPCKADAEKLCPGVQPGGGRIAACLKEHKAEVSDACKANLKQMKAHRAGYGGKAPTDSGN